jgi:hypothetical protein
MSLPDIEEIGDYTCYLRSRPFTNPVAIHYNQLQLYFACENNKTGNIISKEITIDFTDDNREEMKRKLTEWLNIEG